MAQTYGPCGEIVVQTAGGILKPVAFNSGQIAAGESGDVLTATAGANQYLRIRHLTGQAAETGITLTIDGVDIFSNETLDDTAPTGTAANGTAFIVSEGFGSTNVTSAAKVLTDVYCLSFTVTKVTGSTAADINYSYDTLEGL